MQGSKGTLDAPPKSNARTVSGHSCLENIALQHEKSIDAPLIPMISELFAYLNSDQLLPYFR